MPDFVNQTDSTDQNADSTGCGMAFLSWLMCQGHSLSQIAPAMVALGDAGTLAQLYANLTSDAASNAWPNFQNAIHALPSGVISDNPFGAAQAAQIASVRLPKVRTRAAKAPNAPAAICQPRSKRLLPPARKTP
jgi:hypothetical protein